MKIGVSEEPVAFIF